MAKALPKLLINMSMFIDGQPLGSLNTNVTLPNIVMRTKDHQGGGMFASVAIPVGMEPLELRFNMVEYDATLIGLFGRAEIQATWRGQQRSLNGDETFVVVSATGMIRELTDDERNIGDGEGASQFVMSLTFYAVEIDGAEVVHVDVVNGKAIFGGEDLAGNMREGLGL